MSTKIPTPGGVTTTTKVCLSDGGSVTVDHTNWREREGYLAFYRPDDNPNVKSPYFVVAPGKWALVLEQ